MGVAFNLLTTSSRIRHCLLFPRVLLSRSLKGLVQHFRVLRNTSLYTTYNARSALPHNMSTVKPTEAEFLTTNKT